MEEVRENENGDSERSCFVAPDGERTRTDSSESETSSSSSEDEKFASPPPNKRRKYKRTLISDPRVDTLMTQMNYLSNYIAHCMPSSLSPSHINLPSTSTQENRVENQFLTIPSSKTTLSLGEVNIDHDDSRVVPPANPDRLNELNKLQQFNSQAWKGIRYKKAMQSCIASPGFMGLKINEELCHFNKTKDYLAPTEALMASLSNVVLEQRHLIQQGLQNILDWASAEPANLSANNLLQKFSSNFGPGSVISKNSEMCMQIICGK
jgi:hypothetical protein